MSMRVPSRSQTRTFMSIRTRSVGEGLPAAGIVAVPGELLDYPDRQRDFSSPSEVAGRLLSRHVHHLEFRRQPHPVLLDQGRAFARLDVFEDHIGGLEGVRDDR